MQTSRHLLAFTLFNKKMVASWKVSYYTVLFLLEFNPWATWQRTELTSFCLFFIPVMRNGVSSTFTYGRIYLWSDLKPGYYCEVIHITPTLMLSYKQWFIVSVVSHCTAVFHSWLCWNNYNVMCVCGCTEWHESMWPQVILCLTVLPFSDLIWMYVCDLRCMEGLEMKKDKMKFCSRLQRKYQNGKPRIASQSPEYHVEKKQKSQFQFYSPPWRGELITESWSGSKSPLQKNLFYFAVIWLKIDL